MFKSTLSLVISLWLWQAGCWHQFHSEEKMSGNHQLILCAQNWETLSQPTWVNSRKSTVLASHNFQPRHKVLPYVCIPTLWPSRVLFRTIQGPLQMTQTSLYTVHRLHKGWGVWGYLSGYWVFMGTCESLREILHDELRTSLKLLAPPFLSYGGRRNRVYTIILSMRHM
jgi:hypothetical protein